MSHKAQVPKPTVREMVSLLEGSVPVTDFPKEVYKKVKNGESTGDRLVDLIIVRSGAYVPEVVRPYSEVSERLQKGVGKVALIITKRQPQWRGVRTGEKWQKDKSRVRLPTIQASAAVIRGSEPLIKPRKGTWLIESKTYADCSFNGKKVPNGVAVEFRSGNLPVRDRIEKPAKQLYDSTLGLSSPTQPVYRESTGWRPAHFGPNGGVPPREYITAQWYEREVQSTALLIGTHEINAAGHSGLLAMLKPGLE